MNYLDIEISWRVLAGWFWPEVSVAVQEELRFAVLRQCRTGLL